MPLKENSAYPPFRENFKIMEGIDLSHKSSKSQLGKCQGDCDNDSQCKSGLKCFQRNGYTKVPGCEGGGTRDWDYCTDADLVDKPKPKPPVWARGKGNRGGGYKERGFRGPLTYTKGGYTCQNWMTQYPHKSNDNRRGDGNIIPSKCVSGRYSKERPCTRWLSPWGWCGGTYLHRIGTNCSDWVDMSRIRGLGNHNYCRNPGDGNARQAWCYTTDKNKRWDYC